MLGLTAFLTIPRTEDPQLDPPIYVVTAVLPGATPAEVEQLVTKPIEDAIYRLDRLREVRSRSSDGLSTTRVEFEWGADPKASYNDVVREVNALQGTLPTGVVRLETIRARPIGVTIVQVALESDRLPMRRLEKLADRLRERIAGVSGIQEARYWGAPVTELRVGLDLVQMAALKLTPAEVVAALRAAGAETPVGTVEAKNRRFNVRSGGAFRDPDAVSSVAVRTGGGSVLRVGDIATVGWATSEPDHITRFNGRRAVFVTASQGENQDVMRLSREISAELEAFEKTLPGGVRLVRGFDQSANVAKRLGSLERDFLIALALVAVTLLPIGLRAAGVVMLAIPLSLLIGVLLLASLGFTLNQLAIGGFVVALGILVDDAIVVVENIARRMREGEDNTTAAINGTGQIARAVIGCTACLMLAFVPLLALPEASGEFIRALPVAVLATVFGSFVVAMTVIPLAARVLLRPEPDPEGNRLLRAVNHGIHRFYAPVLHTALDRPKRALIGLLLLTTLSLPFIVAIGSSLFPPAETPQFLVRVELPQGSNLAATDRAVAFAENVIGPLPEVAWVSANVGRGNPQVYYNVGQRETDSAFGELVVSLKAWTPGSSDALIERIRARLARYPGAKFTLVTFLNGPEIEAPVVIRIVGPSVDTLAALARRAEAAMTSTPGLRDIGNPLRLERTDVRLAVDEAVAGAMGVQPGAVRQSTQLALSGVTVANLRDGDGDHYPVKVRLPMDAHNNWSALAKVYVPTEGGASVPLSNVAQAEFETGPARIDRLKRARVVSLTAYTTPGTLTARATDDALRRVKTDVPLPPGYSITLGGEAETSSRSFAGLVPAIVIASVGILAVLVFEFGKFRTVAVVFGIVPFGVLGAVAALWLTGNSLSFTAAIGLIALIGIEIKNSILLVDFTEQLRSEGMAVRKAVEKAGELRFLPVLLTSVTAIAGLLPLAAENSGLYSPLAITLIGGLITSTLFARIATPVMYLLLARNDTVKA